MAQRELISEIKKCAESLEGAYQASGSIANTSSVIVPKTDAAKAIHFPIAVKDLDAALKVLGDLVQDSNYGEGKVTKSDPKVRLAQEIKGEHFAVQGFNVESSGILEDVRRSMVPDAKAVRAELLKLNIYGEGGHFVSHRDTPASRDMFGSLVVCLPVFFLGGSLKIKQPGGTGRKDVTSHDFSDLIKRKSWEGFDERTKSAIEFFGQNGSRYNYAYFVRNIEMSAQERADLMDSAVPSDLISWAAFFGDCEHTVEKVDYGLRLTLTYNLFRVDHEKSDEKEAKEKKGVKAKGKEKESVSEDDDQLLLARASYFQSALGKALKSKEFFPSGGKLGFGCVHLYEDSELPAEDTSLPLQSKASTIHLKGSDALVAVAASSLGLMVSAMRFASAPDLGTWKLEHVPTPAIVERFGQYGWVDGGYVMRKVDMDGIADDLEGEPFSGEIMDYQDNDSEDDSTEVEWIIDRPNFRSYSERANYVSFVEEVSYSATGYYGNEASETNFYTYAALIVNIPPIDNAAREKLIKAAEVAPLDPSAVHGLKRTHMTAEEERMAFGQRFRGLRRPTANDAAIAAMELPQLKKEAQKLKIPIRGKSREELERLVSEAKVLKEAQQIEREEQARIKFFMDHYDSDDL